MATLAKLYTELSLIDNMSKGLGKVQKNVEAWGDNLTRIGQRAMIGVTLPVVAGFTKMVTAASDLNEAASATKTIYGESAKDILRWSKTTANAYGITQAAALEATNTFGQVFKGVGIATEASGDLSTALVNAAGDLASFYNKVPTDVLADLQSGIVGQYEPLLKYGIVLNETTVQQKAFAMTGKTSADELTNAEKILARHTLITEGLGDAQGDAARTANSLANMIRRLRARGNDLAARWGKVLLPKALGLADVLIKLMDRMERLSPRMQKLAMIGLVVAAALGPVLIVIGQMLPAIALLLGPFGLLIAALAALGTAYATNLFGFRDAIHAVVTAVAGFADTLIDAFREGTKVSDLVTRFPAPLRGLARGFLLVADAIGDVVSRFRTGGFRAMLDFLPTALAQVWEGIRNVAGGLVTIALDTAVSVGGWLWDHKDDIWGGIKSLIGWTSNTFRDAISATIDGAISLGTYLASVSDDFGGWLWRRLKGGWRGVIRAGTISIDATLTLFQQQKRSGSFARELGQGIVDAIGELTSLGGDIASALVDHLTSLNWMQWITVDSFGAGQGLGAAIRQAIIAIAKRAIDLIRGTDFGDVTSVLTKIGTAIAAATAAAPAALLALSTAFASFIAGAVTGLIFGEDVDFGVVITKIKDKIEGAITADAFKSVGAKIASSIWDAIQEGLRALMPGPIEDFVFGSGTSGFVMPGLKGSRLPSPGLGFGATGDLGPMFDDSEWRSLTSNIATSLGGLVKVGRDTETKLSTALSNMKTSGRTNLGGLADDAIRHAARMQQMVQQRVQAMQQTVTTTVAQMRTIVGGTIGLLAADIGNRMAQAAARASERANALRSGVVSALQALRGQAPGIMSGFAAAVTGTLANLRGSASSLAYAIGQAIGSGLNAGMAIWASTIATTAAQLVSTAIFAARRAADARSPSRKMMALGDDLVDGLLLPLRAGSREVAAAMSGLVTLPAVGAMAGAGMGGGGTTVTIGDIIIQGERKDSRQIADEVGAVIARQFELREGA